MDLSTTTALVTGANRGFGRALATKLREREVTVVLADLDGERNRQVAADLSCEFAVLDVTDRAANEALVARIEGDHGRLDAAYLNAFKDVAGERVRRAGVRLAHLVNEALDPAYSQPTE